MAQRVEAPRRTHLSRDRLLRAAVALADEGGIESVSMRTLGERLGVVPMALYKHVANKEELLDGIVDVVVGEIDPTVSGSDWKSTIRQRILSARKAQLRHPWASKVIESRTTPTPVVMAYMDSILAIFRAGGFSIDLTHHVMHVLGSRMLGFTQELFTVSAGESITMTPEAQAAMLKEMAGRYPNLAEMVVAIYHDPDSVVGPGCDDQFEFEFAIDVLLDGFEKLLQQGWTSPDRRQATKSSARTSRPSPGATASVTLPRRSQGPRGTSGGHSRALGRER